MNPLLSPSKRLECVHALRDWFRRILRRNADRKMNVISVQDPVLLAVLKGKKFIIPPATDMEARLRAINYSLNNDFPELESPKSVVSTPPPRPCINLLSRLLMLCLPLVRVT